MKLSSLFTEDHILIHTEGTCLRDIVQGLIEAVKDDLLGGETIDEQLEEFTESILKDNKNGALESAPRVYLTRLRTEAIPRLRLALAIPENPIASPEGHEKEINMVFLVVAPLNQTTQMLQSIAAIGRLMASKTLHAALKGVRSPSRIIHLIEESGVDVKRNFCAADIMEPVPESLSMDAPLNEAVEALSRAPDEGLPIIDEKGRLVGEITSREILKQGMPKYMDLLTNPEMLNAFEPFENYFTNASKIKVRDIYRRDFPGVAPSAPIVQVAHKMIAENRRRVYVLDEGKIEGVIYRKSILTRILNQ